jgi:hypothetical protein
MTQQHNDRKTLTVFCAGCTVRSEGKYGKAVNFLAYISNSEQVTKREQVEWTIGRVIQVKNHNVGYQSTASLIRPQVDSAQRLTIVSKSPIFCRFPRRKTAPLVSVVPLELGAHLRAREICVSSTSIPDPLHRFPVVFSSFWGVESFYFVLLCVD